MAKAKTVKKPAKKRTRRAELRTEEEIRAQLEDWKKYQEAYDHTQLHDIWIMSYIRTLEWVLGLRKSIVEKER